MRARLSFAALLVALSISASARADNVEPKTKPPSLDPPEQSFRYRQPYPFVTPGWVITQLIPSPEFAIGDDQETHETKASFGLRWQLTPVLWSWGVHRSISRWRFFVVDPLARMSGSIALETIFEYVGGHVDHLLARPTLKATFPLYQRGEYLAFSMGTSVYTYRSDQHLSHEVGLYTLWGTLGIQGAYTPDHKLMTTLLTLRIRYF